MLCPERLPFDSRPGRSGLWFLKDQEKPVLWGLGLKALFFAQEGESVAGGVLAHQFLWDLVLFY